ncbi:hypothetical protein P3T18_000419 [Paraburkholderia sp. GAS199]
MPSSYFYSVHYRCGVMMGRDYVVSVRGVESQGALIVSCRSAMGAFRAASPWDQGDLMGICMPNLWICDDPKLAWR